MCQPVPCSVCGKITWAGCGDHVDSVKARVPDELWCPGHRSPAADPDPQTDPATAEPGRHDGGFFSRMLRH